MTTRTSIIIGIVVLLVIALAAFAITRQNGTGIGENGSITTFDECASEYPVMESMPRQCATPEGTVYVDSAVGPEEPVVPAPTAGQQVGQIRIDDVIIVETPMGGERVTNPLVVTGEARGNWYFEGSFPVELRDTSGAIIAEGSAEAEGEWMTEDFVPFRVSLDYPAQAADSKGTLILRKENPSDLPANDQSVTVPVTFSGS